MLPKSPSPLPMTQSEIALAGRSGGSASVHASVNVENLGRQRATAVESVRRNREMVSTDRETFLPDLAASLGELFAIDRSLGRDEEALTAAQESVYLYRQLASVQAEKFLPMLAAALNDLSLHLRDQGR